MQGEAMILDSKVDLSSINLVNFVSAACGVVGMDFNFTRSTVDSTIIFPDEAALKYYDEILENRKQGLGMTDAIECYAQLHHSMDAILNLIYKEPVHYDVVLHFSNKLESETMLHLQNLYILELLKFGCVICRQVSPLNKNLGFILVLMPFWRLVSEAERIQLKLPLKSEHFQNVKARFKTADKAKVFSIDRWRKMDLDAEVKALNGRFSAQRMKYFIDPKDKNGLELFSNAQRNLLCYNILHRLSVKREIFQKDEAETLDLEGLVNLKVFITYYALHDGPPTNSSNARSILAKTWRGWITPQPVHLIRSYFGEQIAFHFAWMDHSNWWMLMLGLFGVFVFFYGILKAVFVTRDTIQTDTKNTIRSKPFYSTVFDNEMTLVYGFVTSVWALAQAHFWRRRSNHLSIFWTTDKYLVEESPRPVWRYTEKIPNPITGQLEPHWPLQKALPTKFFSFLGILATFVLLALNVLLYVVYNSAIRTRFEKDSSLSKYSSLVSAIISFITIQALSPLCSWIAGKLTEYENHKTATEYYNSLVAKNLTFDFVNYYGIISYLAIGLPLVSRSGNGTLFGSSNLSDACFSADPSNPNARSCMIDLTVQMGVIFIARAIVRHMLNYLEPVFTRFFEGMKYNGVKDGFNSIGSKYSYKPSDNSNIPQLYSDMALTSVDHWNTYLDGYESATVQFGFIVLFSTAFPLAPLLATIHNIIQWRIDAYNLLYRYKRPFARQAANIGVWEDWVLTLAYLGIAMNALILSFTSEWLLNNIDSFSTKSGNEQWLIRTAFVIIFEHSVLLAYFLVKKLVRSTPQRAINSLKRQAYIEKLLSGEIR